MSDLPGNDEVDRPSVAGDFTQVGTELFVVDLPTQFGVHAQMATPKYHPPESAAIAHDSVIAATGGGVLFQGLGLFRPIGAHSPLCVVEGSPVPPHSQRWMS